MKLSKICVRNFKSISDTGEIHLSGTGLITILAGQNESGKTSLLKALKFFEEGEYDDFEDDKRLGAFPRVEVTFSITDVEYDELKSRTNKKIADYFKQHGFTWVRGSITSDDFQDIKYIPPKNIEEAIKELNASNNDDDIDSVTEPFSSSKFFF